MLKNIGKYIRILSITLAILSFLGFAALGTLFLMAALEEGISEDLRTAGIQATVISFVLCILSPFLNLILYGFGVLIDTAKAQAQDSKRIKEMLQSALSDGMLSEEIARKSAQAQAKLIAHVMAQSPTAAPKKNSRAPVQRPVKEVTEMPAAPAPTAQKTSESTAFPHTSFEEPTLLATVEATDFLKPLSSDEETF